MAEDVVIARFRADLDQVRQEFEAYIDELEKVRNEEKATQGAVKKTTNEVEAAAKKRAAAIKVEQAELKRLQEARKKAFTVDAIDGYNKKINEVKRNISTLRGETENTGSALKSIFAGVASGIGAVFSVQAVLNFSKQTIQAFLEAEESVNRLKFAITQIGNEGELAFEKLLAQSKQLQDISIFSDEDIQATQTALATFGLVSNQIDKLTPKILDFASATKTDLASATDTFLRALEGQSRGLVTAGLKFEDTGTIIGNYNEILESTTKLTGATEEAAKTLTGQLKQQENAVNELEESIGAQLAPSFVKLKQRVYEVIEAFLRYGKVNAITNDDIQQQSRLAAQQVVAGLEQQNVAAEERIRVISQLIEQNKKEQTQLELSVRLRQQTTGITRAEAKVIKDQIEVKKTLIQTYQEEIASIQTVINTNGRILKDEQLRAASLEQLNAMLKENSALQDAVSKDNVKLIELEIEKRKKQTEELEKELAKQLQKLKDINSNARKIPPIELKVKFDTEEVDKGINPIDGPALKPPDATAFNDGIDAVEARTLSGFIKNNEQIFTETQNLVNELLNLYSAYANARIEKINNETDAELDALDAREKANKDLLDKQRISEKDFAKAQEQIQAQRVKAQQEADKKIRDIKRREFTINKVAAISEILISTAKNIAANPKLIGFYLAIGAAQGAIVAAQPVPYKRGTKNAKGGLSLVGEEGPEQMLLPAGTKIAPAKQSKKYEKVFDAMVDDRLEGYVFANYVAPALEAQQRKFNEFKERTFADNLGRSIVTNTHEVNNTVTNGRADFYLERLVKGGIPISNANQLAEAIYQRTRTSTKRS